MAFDSSAGRPLSPVRDMEPDFDVLESAPISEERKLPAVNMFIEHRLFQEENGTPSCFALKVHNPDGYSFYIKGDKLPYAMEVNDPIYIVERRLNDIPSSAKEGLMTAVGLEIKGLVFEKSNELVIVTRCGYNYEERAVVRSKPRETSPHYLVFPSILYSDFFDESPETINNSIQRATEAINKNSTLQCFDGIEEMVETLNKYKSTILEFSDVCRRFLEECHLAIDELIGVIQRWEEQPISKEREDKLKILRHNLHEKRKRESQLVPLSRVVVDKKHFIEQMIEETFHLKADLGKSLEHIHNVTYSSS